eukprot:1721141-Heterocapsa_arctica.AAC.1
MGGRATHAQEYPERLCRAICLGVKEQLRDDEDPPDASGSRQGQVEHQAHDTAGWMLRRNGG